MDDQTLQDALMQAHNDGDHLRLVDLYTEAADRREEAGDIDACCFFLTHAYVFALEQGSKKAVELNRRLAERGRAELMKP